MATSSIIYASFLLISAAALTVTYSVYSPKIKGFLGERKNNKSLKKLQKQGIGKHLKDITLSKDGYSSQIDHLFINRSGIFVVETKNYSGELSGSEFDKEWTQTIGDKSYSAHNFARQNYSHIKALQPILAKYPTLPVYSILSFNPSCKLNLKLNKTVAVTYNNLNNAIKIRSRNPVLSEKEVDELFNILKDEKKKNHSVSKTHAGRVSLQQGYEQRAQDLGVTKSEMNEMLVEKYTKKPSIDLTKNRKTDFNNLVSDAAARSNSSCQTTKNTVERYR